MELKSEVHNAQNRDLSGQGFLGKKSKKMKVESAIGGGAGQPPVINKVPKSSPHSRVDINSKNNQNLPQVEESRKMKKTRSQARLPPINLPASRIRRSPSRQEAEEPAILDIPDEGEGGAIRVPQARKMPQSLKVVKPRSFQLQTARSGGLVMVWPTDKAVSTNRSNFRTLSMQTRLLNQLTGQENQNGAGNDQKCLSRFFLNFDFFYLKKRFVVLGKDLSGVILVLCMLLGVLNENIRYFLYGLVIVDVLTILGFLVRFATFSLNREKRMDFKCRVMEVFVCFLTPCLTVIQKIPKNKFLIEGNFRPSNRKKVFKDQSRAQSYLNPAQSAVFKPFPPKFLKISLGPHLLQLPRIVHSSPLIHPTKPSHPHSTHNVQLRGRKLLRIRKNPKIAISLIFGHRPSK